MTKTQQTIEALKSAQTNNAAFDALVEAIRGDRTIHTTEAREIAQGFLGYTLTTSKGRSAAIEAIVVDQRISARQAARGRVLDRSINAW